ncbi:MAG: L-threonylcarbamoyladenylate synthase [Merismopedia sp. SIO2A8]|nr:L-threonylcarbamoyladenylate synthase [Merismopedia sp. SIO2A8]
MMQVSLEALITSGKQGTHLISMQTDTVPALACRPDAAAMIYAAKQRSFSKPLILMGSHPDDLWGYVQQNHPAFELWQQVASKYWPGAITLVLPASDRLPHAVNPTNPTTIGLRVPNCAIARHILHHTGPLATTSVNRSGHPPLETIETINKEFPDVLTLSPQELAQWKYPPSNLAHLSSDTEENAPEASFGTPSTVIAWTDNGWNIIRQGSVSFPQTNAPPASS